MFDCIFGRMLCCMLTDETKSRINTPLYIV